MIHFLLGFFTALLVISIFYDDDSADVDEELDDERAEGA